MAATAEAQIGLRRLQPRGRMALKATAALLLIPKLQIDQADDDAHNPRDALIKIIVDRQGENKLDDLESYKEDRPDKPQPHTWPPAESMAPFKSDVCTGAGSHGTGGGDASTTINRPSSPNCFHWLSLWSPLSTKTKKQQEPSGRPYAPEEAQTAASTAATSSQAEDQATQHDFQTPTKSATATGTEEDADTTAGRPSPNSAGSSSSSSSIALAQPLRPGLVQDSTIVNPGRPHGAAPSPRSSPDAENPVARVLEFLSPLSSSDRQTAAANPERQQLQRLTRTELKARAKESVKLIPKLKIDQADDDDHNPKDALIEIILAPIFYWRVQRAKLTSIDKEEVSALYEALGLAFRMKMTAKVTHKGKRGGSFQKAKGVAFVSLKCDTELPSTVKWRFRISVGTHDEPWSDWKDGDNSAVSAQKKEEDFTKVVDRLQVASNGFFVVCLEIRDTVSLVVVA